MKRHLAISRRNASVLAAVLAFALCVAISARADDNAAAPQPVRFNLRAELLSQSSFSAPAKWQALSSDSSSVIHSGDVIRYTLDVVNTGAPAVSGLVVTQPIPDGTIYILNTVRQTVSYASVTYLAGGASQYAAHPVAAQTPIKSGVATPTPDLSPTPVPAPADSYQQVRWTFTQPLPGRTSVQVSYQVLVR